MNYNRFFAFGCSFTKLFWPTWADLLGSISLEYYNYGKEGAGNSFITNEIVKANLLHSFNKDDLVIVMWSTFFRLDRYYKDNWINHGHVWSEHHSKEDKELFKRVWDNKWGVIQSLTNMYLIKQLLEKSGVNYIFTSFLPVNSTQGLKENPEEVSFIFEEEFKCFKSLLESNWVNDIWSYNTVEEDFKWYKCMYSGKLHKDIHPTPKTFERFLVNEIYAKINLTDNNKNSIKEKSILWHKELMDKNLNSGDKIKSYFNDELSNLRKVHPDYDLINF